MLHLQLTYLLKSREFGCFGLAPPDGSVVCKVNSGVWFLYNSPLMFLAHRSMLCSMFICIRMLKEKNL